MKVYETQDQVFMGPPRPLGFVPGCTGTFNFYAMEKKYLHEAVHREINELIKEKITYGEFREKYRQPDWCGYPDAIDPTGCWSLMLYALGDEQIKISREYCKACELYKEKKDGH